MLSRGGLYALQAALHLARHSADEAVSAARMADALDLPPEYLAKVLRRLTQKGMLESSRGARGGYRLALPPAALTVAEVVRPFEELAPLRVCLLGGPCHSDRPCPAHMRRVEWNAARERLLAVTTLTDLLPDAEGATSTPATVS